MTALLLTALVGTTLVGITMTVWAVGGIRPMTLLADPMAAVQGSWYAGSISVTGVLFLTAAASATGFAAWLTKLRTGSTDRLLRWLALFTLALALDDQFMVHERVLPLYTGVPEWGVYAIYFIVFLAAAHRFHRRILAHPDVVILLVAIGCFATMFLLDFTELSFAGRQAIEETFKLFGTLFWATFLLRIARSTCRAIVPPGHQPTTASEPAAARVVDAPDRVDPLEEAEATPGGLGR